MRRLGYQQERVLVVVGAGIGLRRAAVDAGDEVPEAEEEQPRG